MVTIKDIENKLPPFLCHHFPRTQGRPDPIRQPRNPSDRIFHGTGLGYTKHIKKQAPQQKAPSVLSNGTLRGEELADLYYYSIRASIRQTASLLGYQIIAPSAT